MGNKKKILFISNPMRCGGIEKALLSILSALDCSKYDIYFMPYTRGEFEWDDLIPSYVCRIDPPAYLHWHMMYRNELIKFFFNHMYAPGFIVSYLQAIVKGWKYKFMDVGRQWFWVWNKKKYPEFDIFDSEEPNNFDIAIDFRGEIGCYFMIDKIKANKKIAWYHGDYRNYPRDKEIDEQYLSKLDRIVCVSEMGKEGMISSFPSLRDKVVVIHNLIIKEQLYKASLDTIEKLKKESFYIIQVGRLDVEKGYFLALEACKILIEKGYNIEWHVCGDGPLKKEINKRIDTFGLRDCFILEGMKSNPYPYYRIADCYLHTAYMEGKPITIDEAKIFGLPIVSTCFSTVTNQIENGVNGSIVKHDPAEIADAIEKLITTPDLRKKYKNRLLNNPVNCQEDINRIELLFDE